jgi:hypothetical protein
MSAADTGQTQVRRARIEEIRDLAAEYAREQMELRDEPANPPLPEGGVFWVATDPTDGRKPVTPKPLKKPGAGCGVLPRVLNIFRTLAHHPKLLRRVRQEWIEVRLDLPIRSICWLTCARNW